MESRENFSPANHRNCATEAAFTTSESGKGVAFTGSAASRVTARLAVWLCLIFFAGCVITAAQTHSANLPFEVSNPKNKQWSPDEANRIYNSACQLLARTVRPDKPPELHPRFLLVLGAKNDEFVRDGSHVEVHLKNWQPEIFAQAVVNIAVRDLLRGDQLWQMAHQSVVLANSTIDVHEIH